MYFVHSYYADLVSENEVLSTTSYGGIEYCSCWTDNWTTANRLMMTGAEHPASVFLIEKISTRPDGHRMDSLLENYGAWKMALDIYFIDQWQPVAARQWVSKMIPKGGASAKKRYINAAKEKWPLKWDLIAKKRVSGMAAALWIAEFCRIWQISLEDKNVKAA
jgi:hypothetical protein